MLAKEPVVRFVRASIDIAVDRQKRNADKHGRATVLLLDVGDLFLLSTLDLPKHVVTNVGSSELLPKHVVNNLGSSELLLKHVVNNVGSSELLLKYIVPFRVLHRKDNAYTIELP